MLCRISLGGLHGNLVSPMGLQRMVPCCRQGQGHCTTTWPSARTRRLTLWNSPETSRAHLQYKGTVTEIRAPLLVPVLRHEPIRGKHLTRERAPSVTDTHGRATPARDIRISESRKPAGLGCRMLETTKEHRCRALISVHTSPPARGQTGMRVRCNPAQSSVPIHPYLLSSTVKHATLTHPLDQTGRISQCHCDR